MPSAPRGPAPEGLVRWGSEHPWLVRALMLIVVASVARALAGVTRPRRSSSSSPGRSA